MLRRLLFVAALFAIAASTLPAQTAPAPTPKEDAHQDKADDIIQDLLKAIIAKDYAAFVRNGTPEVKAALAQSQFDATCYLLKPKLSVGYQLTPLGQLNKNGMEVYLYRIRYDQGGDDTLGTLTLRGDQVAGIYFK